MKTEYLNVWEKTRLLVLEIYEHFGVSYDIDFENYLCRSVIELCDQLAFCLYEPKSIKTLKKLYKSLGQAKELEAMLHLAERLKHIEKTKRLQLDNKNKEITQLIRQLIQSEKS